MLHRIESAIRNGRIHHAFLLVSPSRSKAKTIAEEISKKLLQTNNLNTSPDFFSLDSSYVGNTQKKTNQITIEEIRQLETFCRSTPCHNLYRAIVINGADHLNYQAANGLLKILEEPGERTIFFMVASLVGKILPTIRSRCCIVYEHFTNFYVFQEALKSACLELQKADIELLFTISEGEPNLAISLLNGDTWSIIQKIKQSFVHRESRNIHEIIAFANRSSASWKIVQSSLLHFLRNAVIVRAKTSLKSLKLEMLEKTAQLSNIVIDSDAHYLDKEKVIMACLR